MKKWIPEYFHENDEPELAQKYTEKLQDRSECRKARQRGRKGTAAPKTERRSEEGSAGKQPEISQPEACKNRGRKAIDPETLNLPAVQKAFEEAFGEGSTRTDPVASPGSYPRDKLGMMLLMSKLEHEPLNKFLQRPDVQAIVSQPGFFRQSKGGPMTPERARVTLKQWWQKNAMPVIQKVAPVLYGLLGRHHKYVSHTVLSVIGKRAKRRSSRVILPVPRYLAIFPEPI